MNTNENLSQSQIARQRTAEDLRQLLHDAEQMIAATRHDGSERLHAVRERLESSARQVREAFYDGERACSSRLVRALSALTPTSMFIRGPL